MEADILHRLETLTSASGTSTSSHGPLGALGTVAGKAIVTVGDLIIRGIERVSMRARLRSIKKTLHSEGHLSLEAIQDIAASDCLFGAY